MSRTWLPWRENPNRYKLEGAKAVVWRPLLLVYRIFQRFPNSIFWGLCVTVPFAVWLISMWLDRIDSPLLRDLAGLIAIIGFISLIPLFTIWWERKVSAHIQNRTGPMRVGGWHGWTQSMADGMKLLCKEDFIPPYGDRLLFRLAPYLTFIPPIVAFIVLPFGTYWVFRETDVALLFVLGMLGIEVLGILLGGWASNNKWSVYGSMREACQMVSYEIPLGMALLLPIMAAGTLNLREIGMLQSGGWFDWLAFQNPFLFAAALSYYIASLASCKRAPFDLPESESELVAGFLTEYSGFRWSMFFFGEYCAMFVVSALAVLLFFGGWYSPLSHEWCLSILQGWGLEGWSSDLVMGLVAGGPIWFILKSFTLLYVQIWIRWTLPRVRIDQVLYACIQVILPLVMLLLLANAFWLLWIPETHWLSVATRIVLGIIGAVVLLSFVSVAISAYFKRRALVGYLATDILPGA